MPGIAAMGKVRRPRIYNLFGEQRLSDAISAAGPPTSRAGRAVTISHTTEPKPNKPIIVGSGLHAPQRSPAGNVQVFLGDTVVVSSAAAVYVLGAVAHPAAFVMEGNERLTVLPGGGV